jgi:hypothetical protein
VSLIGTELCGQPTKFLCDKAWKDKLPLLSVSSYKTWVRCRYAYYLRKICGIKLKDQYASTPIKMGKIWDKFIGSLYGIKFDESDLDKLVNQYQIDDISIAKVDAMMSAWKELGIKVRPGGKAQKYFEYEVPGLRFCGFLDVAYDDYFCEDKFTNSPLWYHDTHNMKLQLGWYFISNPGYDKCILRTVQVPQLKRKRKGVREESLQEYFQRMFEDIMQRPAHYFYGLDTKSNVINRNVVYYRNEFDLEYLKMWAMGLTRDMVRAKDDGNSGFYPSWQCTVPGKCDYREICDTGKVSGEMYDIGCLDGDDGDNGKDDENIEG